MSIYTISNGNITLKIDGKGAEIKSLKSGEREYMWHGDPAFWGRTSPVLFPVVGSLKGKEFRHGGETYSMGQHGFARDTAFTLVDYGDEHIRLKLESNEETLKKYPYEFALEIGYELGERSVKVTWKVTNPSKDQTLDFSIGAHPAFLCGTEGYSFHLYQKAEASTHNGNEPKRVPTTYTEYQKLMADGSGTLDRTGYGVELENGRLAITQDLFLDDALIFTNTGVCRVALADENDQEYLKVDFDAPLFGLWTPAGKNAPFVCIEPWYGRCDAADFTGDWEEREFSNHVAPGACFERSYKIKLG